MNSKTSLIQIKKKRVEDTVADENQQAEQGNTGGPKKSKLPRLLLP